MSKVKAKIVGNYKIYFEHLLGQGMMGKVHLGQKTGTNTYVAVKEVNIKCLDEYKRKQIQNEIQNSSLLESTFIVRLYDHCQTENNLYMFLEFCEDGDLKSYIAKRNGRLSEAEAVRMILRSWCSSGISWRASRNSANTTSSTGISSLLTSY